jgi:phosphatidylserine/phosphatidylglycerophosphate/cardiolipin synthase-like enzyme
VVVADQTRAFVTSANLTGSAMENNLEAGLLAHGGTVPRRLADHFSALMRVGVIQPLPAAGR